MSKEKLKNGDVFENDGNTIIINNIKGNTYTGYTLNGFYDSTIEDNKRLNMFYDSSDDKIEPHKNNDLSCYMKGLNLKFKIGDSFKNNYLDDWKFKGNVNNDKQLNTELNYYFVKTLNKISPNFSSSAERIKFTILFSKNFDKFNNSNTIKNYKIGDIFSDNLQSTNFFLDEDNKDSNLTKNYWMCYKITKKGFLAFHLETMTLFHFNKKGEVEYFINDLDNRISLVDGGYNMNKSVISELDMIINNINYLDKIELLKNKNIYYQIQDIHELHFFNGIKLIKLINLNEIEKYTINNKLIENIKNIQNKYNFYTNSTKRYISSTIEKTFNESINEKYFTEYWIDNNKKLNKSERNIHERYEVDQYIDKFYKVSSLIPINNNDTKYIYNVNYENKMTKINVDFAISIMRERFKTRDYIFKKDNNNYKSYLKSLIKYLKLSDSDFDNSMFDKINNEYDEIMTSIQNIKEKV